MLVFIDESGDPGRKTTQGSSRFFVLAVVMFDDDGEAARCERAIERLADRLGRGSAEFKFSKDSNRTRLAFLDVVEPFRFRYRAFVLNKDPARLYGPGFNSKDSLYRWVCGTALKDVSGEWEDATVVLDRSGEKTFQRELTSYLRREVRSLHGPGRIKRVKANTSDSERLLQLADYVAGVVNRYEVRKKWGSEYFRRIRGRGVIRRWPT
ncbi:MAG: DUF3800 domain-containing protein [Chloroflexi bacterium]|nr:DUF3800 domain-containing protein [Chloroflexota bacterium]